MARTSCVALLLGLSGLLTGCSTPSYRIPAGFSSTYHSAIYGGVEELHPQEPAPVLSTDRKATHPAGAALR